MKLKAINLMSAGIFPPYNEEEVKIVFIYKLNRIFVYLGDWESRKKNEH